MTCASIIIAMIALTRCLLCCADKPHSPYIVPEKYFELYDGGNVSLAPNPHVPSGFMEENWHNNGNQEIEKYQATPQSIARNGGSDPFNSSVFNFTTPVNDKNAREIRHAYFAATSFIDAQIGRVMDALDSSGYLESTVVGLWSDHGYHLVSPRHQLSSRFLLRCV